MFKTKTEKSRNKLLRKMFLLLCLLIILSIIIISRNFEFITSKNSLISPLSKTTSPNVNLEKLLQSKNISYTKIDETKDSSFVVQLSEGGEVSISAKKSLSEQISSLQLILSRLTIEGKKFKFLDLRFDKPVIVF